KNRLSLLKRHSNLVDAVVAGGVLVAEDVPQNSQVRAQAHLLTGCATSAGVAANIGCAMNGLQLNVAQFKCSGGIGWEHRLLLCAQAAAIRLVFPCANDVEFHNDLFLSFFFLPMLLWYPTYQEKGATTP